MRIAAGFTCKMLSALRPGELFVMGHGTGQESIKAIKLSGREGDTRNFMVVLSSPDEIPEPKLVAHTDEDVLSLGEDWVLVPILSDGIGTTNFADKSVGQLVQHADTSLMLRVGSERGTHVHFVDLQEFSAPQRAAVSYGFTIGQWEIWLSEEHRSRPGSKPFFRFPSL